MHLENKSYILTISSKATRESLATDLVALSLGQVLRMTPELSQLLHQREDFNPDRFPVHQPLLQGRYLVGCIWCICQLRSRPRHLTMVQNDEVRCQKPSSS
ncbi:hypothetical protein TNCV_1103371 [Trichonephila clavipes]|nr:hypothetical protein TNCV_1103371 [Trichonephila clavipes]